MLHGSIGKVMRPDQLAWSSYKWAGAREQAKVHDYTQLHDGVDFVIEAIADGSEKYHMTGQGKGVRTQHIIYIQRNNIVEKYRVECIDYYSSPSDMWNATLTKIG
ncbi:hypothetical protein OsccyDRAFT_2915 [Leptolyngbyaceae cyanobacterium JSC-12]|nr:hypothetical protein OsccyDRAFT_2915 [Leptolyngbyaceae cyanobacterium JSC-12]